MTYSPQHGHTKLAGVLAASAALAITLTGCSGSSGGGTTTPTSSSLSAGASATLTPGGTGSAAAPGGSSGASVPGSTGSSHGASKSGAASSAPVSPPPTIDSTAVDKNAARNFRFPNVSKAKGQELVNKFRPMKIVAKASYSHGAFILKLKKGATRGQLNDITNEIVDILNS